MGHGLVNRKIQGERGCADQIKVVLQRIAIKGQ